MLRLVAVQDGPLRSATLLERFFLGRFFLERPFVQVDGSYGV